MHYEPTPNSPAKAGDYAAQLGAVAAPAEFDEVVVIPLAIRRGNGGAYVDVLLQGSCVAPAVDQLQRSGALLDLGLIGVAIPDDAGIFRTCTPAHRVVERTQLLPWGSTILVSERSEQPPSLAVIAADDSGLRQIIVVPLYQPPGLRASAVLVRLDIHKLSDVKVVSSHGPVSVRFTTPGEVACPVR